MSMALVESLEIVPLFERLKPIFTQKVESDSKLTYPNKIKGLIELSNVSFRYSTNIAIFPPKFAQTISFTFSKNKKGVGGSPTFPPFFGQKWSSGPRRPGSGPNSGTESCISH